MIDRREILEAASAFSLLPSIVEKDYLLGWMLAGINALEMQPVPITAESYIKAIGPRFSQKGSPLEVRGSPEEHAMGGRTFWKQDILVHTASGTACAAQFVATEKGNLLMFSLSAPDPKALEDLEKTLESIHFLQGSS
jgi:hypothetical protein